MSDPFEDSEDWPDGHPPRDLNLRAKHHESPLTRDSKRFDFFVIDTGWNTPVSKALRQHLPVLQLHHPHDTIYVLTPEQSVAALRNAPYLIGHDPTLIVYDMYGSAHTAGKYRGFRLNLGLMRNGEQAMARLQEFSRFVAEHRTATCLDCEVRRELHREGVSGMMKIMREGLEASVELI
ncbi:MAG: hypothetical protein U0835_18520 [Isosphaeraceae bacterium]